MSLGRSYTLKILHVTEAMSSGVLSLIESLSRRQTCAGANVSVMYVERPDTPSLDSLKARFDSHIQLIRVSDRDSKLYTYLQLAFKVRQNSTHGIYDVIHLHSSKAGALGRIGAIGRRKKTIMVYSPHGFAFLREDTSRAMRFATLNVEKLLAKLSDSIILTSPSEHTLAHNIVRARRTSLLRTGVSDEFLKNLPSPTMALVEKPLRVGMVGRVCYQKAPWRFATVASALSKKASFVWIGGGTNDDTKRWLEDSPVHITGWLSPEDLTKQIHSLDVLLFPTLWEGMSLSLMQAQAQGIPAVVSRVVGNVDSVIHEKTGFICDDDAELIEATLRLLDDKDLRQRMSNASIEWAREMFSDENLGKDSIRIYSDLLGEKTR